MKHLARLAAVLGLALTVALTGCGSDSAGSSDTESSSSGAVAYDDSEPTTEEIVKHLKLTEFDGSYGYYQDCEVLVLAGQGQVSMYADAGDNVASNPDQTAGVKITSGPEKECHGILTEALSDL